MEELIKLLESFHPLAPELQAILLHSLPREIHRANKYILEAGEVCDWVAFMEKGLVRIYYELPDESERIIWFHRKGDVIGSMKSYYSGASSKLCIRTMEETFIRKIKKSDLNALYQKFPEFNINGRCITEQYYSMSEDHVILLAMPPKDMYKKLSEEYPWILNDPRIKDYMLAGYFGINKNTLTRYRNENK